MNSISNIIYSDRGLPLSKYLSRVDPKTKIPVIACLTATSIAALLTLIYVGSATAFNDVISLTITGFYGSYLLPAAFLLYHRVKGHILPKGSDVSLHQSQESPKPSSSDNDDDNSNMGGIADTPLVWGPWHVPGIFGIINNAYACIYMVFVIFWSVWPPATPVKASTMNYSVVVTGGVLILSAVWYYVGGKKQYKGPLIDEEVREVLRVGSVVLEREGKK